MKTIKSDESAELPEFLQNVRGRVRCGAVLAKRCWFQVGGEAEYLVTPHDVDDLSYLLANKPDGMDCTIIGVGSNLLVRDGGIDGLVVRLGRSFAGIEVLEGNRIRAGAAAMDANVATIARDSGIAWLEFLVGIPGTIGGALRMNAGAYGVEIKDVLVEAEAVDAQGERHIISCADMGLSYRHCSIPNDWVFTSAIFSGQPDKPEVIGKRMDKIIAERSEAQPVKSRTGGSTFKNPDGHKAWQLVDEAACRGLKVGSAQVSEKHCNFLINTGGATASDLESLGDEVRKRVKATSGIDLVWEIKRIGKN